MASKAPKYSLEEAQEKLAKIFENIQTEQEEWNKKKMAELKPVEDEMEKCIKENCWAYHKQAQSQFRKISSGINHQMY